VGPITSEIWSFLRWLKYTVWYLNTVFFYSGYKFKLIMWHHWTCFDASSHASRTTILRWRSVFEQKSISTAETSDGLVQNKPWHRVTARWLCSLTVRGREPCGPIDVEGDQLLISGFRKNSRENESATIDRTCVIIDCSRAAIQFYNCSEIESTYKYTYGGAVRSALDWDSWARERVEQPRTMAVAGKSGCVRLRRVALSYRISSLI